MKSFRFHVQENTTANMTYATRDFQVDNVPVDFDVGDYVEGDLDYPDENKKMRPWEIRNAEQANERRETVLRWLKAAGGNQRLAVNDNSIPQTPKWQSRSR